MGRFTRQYLVRSLSFAALLLLPTLGCDRTGDPGTIPPNVRVPQFEYQETSGCGRCTVYQTNSDKSEVFVVFANLDALLQKEGVAELNLEIHTKTISVSVNGYPRPQKHLHLCTDFTDPSSDPPEIWTGIRGKVWIERFPPEKGAEGPMPTFRVKVSVTEAEFRSAGGYVVKCPHEVVLDTTVGWTPG